MRSNLSGVSSSRSLWRLIRLTLREIRAALCSCCCYPQSQPILKFASSTVPGRATWSGSVSRVAIRRLAKPTYTASVRSGGPRRQAGSAHILLHRIARCGHQPGPCRFPRHPRRESADWCYGDYAAHRVRRRTELGFRVRMLRVGVRGPNRPPSAAEVLAPQRDHRDGEAAAPSISATYCLAGGLMRRRIGGATRSSRRRWTSRAAKGHLRKTLAFPDTDINWA